MKKPRFKISLIALIILISVVSFTKHPKRTNAFIDELYLPYLKETVLEFANKYRNKSVIVVSKKDHLLFFCKNGEIVQNDGWNGFTYNFPVKVSLASRFYRTPEGEMYIDAKNPNSRYILFLHLSYPGAYGIHSAPTYLKRYLERQEKINPNFEFATKKDDTRGCVAVENRVIKYLYANVDLNTPVLILP